MHDKSYPEMTRDEKIDFLKQEIRQLQEELDYTESELEEVLAVVPKSKNVKRPENKTEPIEGIYKYPPGIKKQLDKKPKNPMEAKTLAKFTKETLDKIVRDTEKYMNSPEGQQELKEKFRPRKHDWESLTQEQLDRPFTI